jgi:mRNA-degrading endonuclease YafQ of YafQ-DinJ toxin-antitoxin module
VRTLYWAPSFRRAFRKYVRRHPQSQDRIVATLRQLAESPYAPQLDTHKLSGALAGLWACSVEYDCRIVFIRSLTWVSSQ